MTRTTRSRAPDPTRMNLIVYHRLAFRDSVNLRFRACCLLSYLAFLSDIRPRSITPRIWIS